MSPLLNKWWPLVVWVLIAPIIVLAGCYPVIPYKLFEFLFLFWIGISIVGFIPVGAELLTDIENRLRTRKVDSRIEIHTVREFDFAQGKVIEHEAQKNVPIAK